MKRFRDMPHIEGPLIKIEPIEVNTTEMYKIAKHCVSEALYQTEGARKGISDSDEHKACLRLIGELKRFIAEVLAGTNTCHDLLNNVLETVSQHSVQLTAPARELLFSLENECNRYSETVRSEQEQKERILRQKDEQRTKQTEWERNMLTLRSEVATARQAADNAERTGDMEIAKAIRAGLQKFHAIDTAPQTIKEPLKSAKEVRRLLAVALAVD